MLVGVGREGGVCGSSEVWCGAWLGVRVGEGHSGDGEVMDFIYWGGVQVEDLRSSLQDEGILGDHFLPVSLSCGFEECRWMNFERANKSSKLHRLSFKPFALFAVALAVSGVRSVCDILMLF